MNFYENMKIACKSRKISLKRMGQLAGLGKNSWQNWKDHDITAENLLSISKALNTTMEYLMGETSDIDAKVISEAPGAASISPDEKELLQIYRAVSIEGKATILTSARAFAGQVDFTKKAATNETA